MYWHLIIVEIVILWSCFSGRRVTFNEFPEMSSFNGSLLRSRILATEPPLKPSDHLIESIPGLAKSDKIGNQYAGHLLADPSKGGYHFYWLFESPSDSESKPLLIFLNGGPGCSSMDGLFLELGPLRLDNNGAQIRINPHSWHNVANVLFIDQPVGTGLSFTSSRDGLAKNDETINRHVYTFLINFLTLHDRYLTKEILPNGRRRTRPIVFTGESHAGHYIPLMVKHFIQQNSDPATKIEIYIQKIALGNPWIDPKNQYNPAEFAHGHGLLTRGQVNHLETQDKLCRQNLKENKLNTKACLTLLDNVIDATSTGNGQKVIMYDIRKFSGNPRYFPPGHETVENYLNRPDVRKALHVGSKFSGKFVECADPPYYALAHQDGKGVTAELEFLLDKNLPILIYSGQYDLICNHLNIERAVDELQWSGRGQWLSTPPGVWLVGNKPAGYVRQARNLQTLTVLDGGHMLPMNLPEISLQMITMFLQDKSFSSGASRVGVTPVIGDGSGSGSISACGTLPETTSSSSSTNNDKISIVNQPQTPTRRELTDGMKHHSYSSSIEQQVSHYPVLLNTIPLETGIFIRLRAQHRAHNSAPSHQQQHTHHHVVSKQAWEAIAANTLFHVLIQPGDRIVHLHSPVINVSNHHVDIILDQLQPGVAYSISLQYGYNLTTNFLPASFHRQINVHIGCYFAGFAQCCHHGECLASSGGSSKCHCDSAYSGDHCNHYAVLPPRPVGNNKAEHHYILHNISADDVVCPPRIHPSLAAVTVNVKNLPLQSSLAMSQSRSSVGAVSETNVNVTNMQDETVAKKDCLDKCCHYLQLSLSAKTTVLSSLIEKEVAALVTTHALSSLKVKVELNSNEIAIVDICGPQSEADKAATILIDKTRVGWNINDFKMIFVTQLTPVERDTLKAPVTPTTATVSTDNNDKDQSSTSSLFAELLPWLSAHWLAIAAVVIVVGLCCMVPLCINGVGTSASSVRTRRR